VPASVQACPISLLPFGDIQMRMTIITAVCKVVTQFDPHLPVMKGSYAEAQM
jgi:hypothetical protein